MQEKNKTALFGAKAHWTVSCQSSELDSDNGKMLE